MPRSLRTVLALVSLLAASSAAVARADAWPDGGVKVMSTNGSVWTLPGLPGQIRVIAQSPLCAPASSIGYAAGVVDTNGNVVTGNGGEYALFCYSAAITNPSLGPPIADASGNVYSLLTSSSSNGFSYSVMGSSLPPNGVSLGGSAVSQLARLLPRNSGSIFAAWANSPEIDLQAIGPSGKIGASARTVEYLSRLVTAACATNGRGVTLVGWGAYDASQPPSHNTYAWGELRALDADGHPVWPQDSIQVAYPVVAIEPDSAGGAYLLMKPLEDYYGITRRDSNGNLHSGWPSFSGVEIRPYGPTELMADGQGGVLYVVASDTGYVVRHLLPTGVIAPGWEAAHLPASAIDVQLAPDGFGGAVLAWSATGHPGTATDAYVQHIFADGSLASPTGIPLAVAAGDQLVSSIRSDLAGNAYVCWSDTRDGTQQAYVSRRAVRPFNSRFAFAISANPCLVARAVTLTVTALPMATGTVNFFDAGAPIGTVAMNNGVASLSYVPTQVGVRMLTARYSGDPQYDAAGDSIAVSVLDRLPTVTKVTSSFNPCILAQAVMLTATVSPAAATGTAAFFDTGVPVGTAAVNNGLASFSYAPQQVGARTVTARYNGDADYDTSRVSIALSVLDRIPTYTTLTTPQTTVTGHFATLTASVTLDWDPTGTFTFWTPDGSPVTLPVGGGTVVLVIHSPAFAQYHVTVDYSGDSGHLPSSKALDITFQGRPATTTLTASADTIREGDTVTLSATVSPDSATGNVTFRDGGAALGTRPLDHGNASFAWSVTGASTGRLTATYSGDTTYATSTGAHDLFVPQQATTTSIDAYAAGGYAGTLLRFTASIDPSPTSGTVEFVVDGQLLSSVSATGGFARTAPDSLPVGEHQVQARFVGTGFYGPSASDNLDVNVMPLPTVPYLRVLAPNNGEVWPIGTSQTIRWNASSNPNPPTVSLYVLRGSTWKAIALGVPNTGSYSWTVTGPAASDAASIRVTDPSGFAVEDESDLPFTIRARVLGVDDAPPVAMLATAFPNPSAGPTSVRFALPSAARVRLSVIDLQGREVAALADGDYAAGRYTAVWDGRGASGHTPAGLYFVRLSAGDHTLVTRVAVVSGR